MSTLADTTAAIRKGEELDLGKLEPYLRSALGVPGGAFSVEQFPGGHSNLTYLVRLDGREMVLRRPPFGSKVKSAHDMGREYLILSRLHPVYPPAPKPLVYCEDESILGAKFYAMERIQGVILRQLRPAGFEASPAEVRRICRGLAENLATLHAVDWRAIGLDALQKKEGSFVQRQVDGWIRRFADSKTEDLPALDQAFDWCRKHIPADVGAVLIHNDYKFDNVILDPKDLARVIGVLDWEMSTIGDPLFDLGVTLGYWMNPDEPMEMGSSSSFLTRMPGAITRLEFAEAYGAKSGRDVSNMHWYYAFAVAKLAVVLQQIYYRYHHGLTKDERFAGMNQGVAMLVQRAAQIIEKGSL
jgi:aminoglycoside phosphotransferase (APT) family kinase protein